jgi:hypothetical protein
MALHGPKRFLIAVFAGTAILAYGLHFFILEPIPNVDVSAEPEYANVIGKRFRTQQDLIAIGVSVDRIHKMQVDKQVDYITLVPLPGFSGPEVITKERLQQGAVLEVVGVLKGAARPLRWMSTRTPSIISVWIGLPMNRLNRRAL